MLYWLLKHVLVGPALRTVFRPSVSGLENVPKNGPAILAINHLSYSDWLFVPLVVDRRVTFVAKSEYFTAPGLKGRLQKSFFSGTGQVPIDRSSGSAAAGALATGLRILQDGDLFGIFPEGTRSPDGRLYKGKTGVARLALESGVPVIPVGVKDTDTVAPPGKKFGRYAQPHVSFGKPLDFSRFQGMGSDRYVLRFITDEVIFEIMQLSGQEYVDEYAATFKQNMAAKARAVSEGAATLARDIQESATARLETASARLEEIAAGRFPRKASGDNAEAGAGDPGAAADASDESALAADGEVGTEPQDGAPGVPTADVQAQADAEKRDTDA